MVPPDKRCVLLDRDGVINTHIPDGYVLAKEQLELIPGAAQAIAKFNEHGFTVGVISNQQCVGKGLLTLDELDLISDRLRGLVRRESGGAIAGFFYCTHIETENCSCRKPKPGLIRQAQRAYGFVAEETYVIGDAYRDVAAARAAGCNAILVLTGADSERYLAGDRPPNAPDGVVKNLLDAIPLVLRGRKSE